MLLWKLLVDAAEKQAIDRMSDRAREWIHAHLKELLVISTNNEGEGRQPVHEYVSESFDWAKEWPTWKRHFESLLWLARSRSRPTKPRTHGDRIPAWVQEDVDEVLKGIPIGLSSDWLSETRIGPRFSGGYEATGRVNDTLDEFWQIVFLTFFWPDALPRTSFCWECGKPVKRTRKLGKVSRARLCPACRVRKWRRQNPDEARAMYREAYKSRRGVANARKPFKQSKGTGRPG